MSDQYPDEETRSLIKSLKILYYQGDITDKDFNDITSAEESEILELIEEDESELLVIDLPDPVDSYEVISSYSSRIESYIEYERQINEISSHLITEIKNSKSIVETTEKEAKVKIKDLIKQANELIKSEPSKDDLRELISEIRNEPILKHLFEYQRSINFHIYLNARRLLREHTYRSGLLKSHIEEYMQEQK